MSPIFEHCNPIRMKLARHETSVLRTARVPSLNNVWTYWILGLCLALCFGASPVLAETPVVGADPVDPLPVDTGVDGLKQMLIRLQTTARLMQTTAHPDDEDGGMLTLESRGHGVTTLLMTLTRGEGGQNKVGSNLFDVLGVLRSLELTASDRYYGVEQRFSPWRISVTRRIPTKHFKSGAVMTSRSATWSGSFEPFGRMFWSHASPEPIVTDTVIIRHPQFSPKKHFGPPPIPTGFLIRSRKACNPGKPKKLIHRKRVRVRSHLMPRGKLHGQTEYRPDKSAIAYVVYQVRNGRIAAPAFAGSRRLVGRTRRSLHLLQAAGFGCAIGRR